MKRRTFLVTVGAMTSVGLMNWGKGGVAHAEPRPASDAPVVSTRTDLVLVAPTVSTVSLDGTFSDLNWGDPLLHETATLYDLDPVDTAVYLVHDETHLYVGVHLTGGMADTMTHASVLVRGAPGSAFRVATVQVREDGPEVSFNWGGDTEEVAEFERAFVVDDAEVTCVLAIPLTTVGITEAVGAELGINVVIDHEDMSSPTTTAVPTRTSSNGYDGRESSRSRDTDVVDQDRVATLLLGEAPGLRSVEGSPLAQPEQFVVEYLGFTRKRLRFGLDAIDVADDFTLEWRAPGGAWGGAELGDVDLVDQGRVRVFETEFSHPAPTAFGQYQLRLSAEVSGRREDRIVIATFDRDDLMRAGDELPANQPQPPQGDEAVAVEGPSAEVAALLDLIPDRTGFRFCGVPDAPELRPQDLFTWSPSEPHQMVAQSTGTVYPNNDYAENQELTVTNRQGETISYPFYEDEEGTRYFLSGHLWYLQREHVYATLEAVAEEDPLGAARLLYRFSQVYQGWVPTNEYPHFNRPVDPSSVPRNFWWGGTWSRWSTSELTPMRQIGNAMLKVQETDAFEVLSDEMGEDVYSLLVEDTIKPSVAWRDTFSPIYHNNDYPSLRGMVVLSWALGDSRWIHETVEWVAEYLRRGFLYDGFWRETTLSYHLQSVRGLLRIADAIEGWSDPEGYISPRTGETLSALDLRERMPVLGSSQRIPNVLSYPNGKIYPMADTWAATQAENPEPDSGSVVYGGGGVARLSRGGPTADSPVGLVFQFSEVASEDEASSLASEEQLSIVAIKDQNAPLVAIPGVDAVELAAEDDGVSITFSLDVAEADNYEIVLAPFHDPAYGRYQISLDGESLDVHDFYSSFSKSGELVSLGYADLSKGEHSLTLIGSGRNEEATGWQMGVRWAALLNEEARELRDSASPAEQANPTQVYQLFTPKYGHNHYDPLTLGLWAEGQELLPDIGYTHTFYRRWTQSTLGHNTVTVDASDLHTSGSDGGALEVFDSGGETCQVMRTGFADAYQQTSMYQRETWSIVIPGSERHESYLLDLFRVRGGDRHEFSLMGDANHDAEMTTSAELAGYGPYLLPDGVEVTEPETENDYGDAEGHYYGYIYVREVQRAELPEGAYDIALTTEIDDEPGPMLNIRGLASSGAELFIGESPSLRSTRLNGTSGDLNSEATKYWAPKFVVRCEGEDLDTDFLTVIEPLAAGTEARIESISKLDHDGPEGTLAVQVTHVDGTVDIVISNQEDNETVTAGGVTLTGKLGFVRTQQGGATAMHLVGGTSLSASGGEVSGTGAVSGAASGTLRTVDGEDVNAVLTSVEVPDWAEGHTLVVYRPDGKTLPYRISAVDRADGQTVLELGNSDPGFSGDNNGGGLTYYPHTEWEGEVSFRVENAQSA